MELPKAFREKYDPKEKMQPKEAFSKFYKEVKEKLQESKDDFKSDIHELKEVVKDGISEMKAITERGIASGERSREQMWTRINDNGENIAKILKIKLLPRTKTGRSSMTHREEALILW